MNKKYTLIVLILFVGIYLINYLNNKLDKIIVEQVISSYEAGDNIVCGDYILNKNNSYLDNGYLFNEEIIEKIIAIKDCNAF